MKTLLAILSIALLSSPVSAEDMPEFGSPMDSAQPSQGQNDSNLWKMLDSNKDGYLSKSEAVYSTHISDRWDSLDTNHDNQLDTAEFSQFYSQ